MFDLAYAQYVALSLSGDRPRPAAAGGRSGRGTAIGVLRALLGRALPRNARWSPTVRAPASASASGTPSGARL